MRAATRDAKLIDARVRDDPRANALFMEVLTDAQRARPGAALDERGRRVRPLRPRLRPRRRADAVRHVPPLYGRRAFDPRDRAAGGDRARRARQATIRCRPLCSARSRRAGRSMSRCCCTTSPRAAAATTACIGAEIALKLGPRFGLDPAETETVAWLVRYHLLMSATAFKRDLADPKTIEDFVRQVQSPERLRLLLILTVVDIRAVGPGVWNEWKRVLLRTLFDAAEERLRLGHKQRGRTELVDARQQELGDDARLEGERSRGPMPSACPTAIGWPSRSNGRSPTRARWRRPKRASAMPVPSVVAENDARQRRDPDQRLHARPRGPVLPHLRRARGGRRQHHRRARPHHPRRHGARQSAGARQPGPRLFRPRGCAAGWCARSRRRSTARSRRRCRRATGAARAPPRSESRRRWSIAERASSRTTVVEVNALDRLALLAALARRDPRLRPPHPFGAYRDLWRARGRRLLSDPRGRQEARRRRSRRPALGACSPRPRDQGEARAA